MRKPTIEIWQGGTFLLYDSIEGTLYTEDGSEYKTQPKPAAKAPTAKAQPKPQPKPQMSMFDLMGEDLEGKPEEEKPEDDEDTMPSNEEIQEIMAEIAEEEKAKQQKPTTSPVYRKYLDVQDRYPQAIIAMRLGDFYEVFGKNAEVLANELPFTLTGRDCGLESRVPIYGIQRLQDNRSRRRRQIQRRRYAKS